MSPEIILRPAEEKDCKLLWEWRNEKAVRESSFSSEYVLWEEHKKWFQKKLRNKNSIILIIQNSANKEIGQVRFDMNRNDSAEVDIGICKEERGKGYGLHGLKMACNYIFKNSSMKSVTAYIKKDNLISLNTFLKSGFISSGLRKFKGHLCYELFLNKKMSNYVLATIKSWNIKNLNKLQEKIKANWMLITRRKDLSLKRIKDFNPKYIFFPHWSWIIPEKIYKNFECVIFHMADLPFGRGGSPLQNLIERRIHKTKISALKCDKGIDSGPIYLKKELSLHDSAEEIFKRASNIIFKEMIPYIIKKEPKPIPQRGKVMIFKRRTPKQSNISNLNSLKKVYDYIRMLDAEDYPNAFIKTPYLKFEFTNAKFNKNTVNADVKITLEKKK